MTVVEGQIETLKTLKESLSRSGITRFDSIGEINRFLRDYETEKESLPSRIEAAFEAEIQKMQSILVSDQQAYDELKTSIRNGLKQKIQKLEVESEKMIDKSNKNIILKVFYFLKIKSLSHRKTDLEKNLEKFVKTKTSNEENAIARLKTEIDDQLRNKERIVAERCKKPLEKLAYTKKVVDGLYPLIAGVVGESAVVKALQQLPDDCYLINDFSVEFDPPIYNKKENDRIYSVQIDHLLVCRSGVFLLETKNWSKSSVDSLDLRSPVEQIRRTSFALFVLLNSDSNRNHIELESHHWGVKKIPIRNIIVMVNAKPREEFRHVKVLSIDELIGYIQYFDQILSAEEVKSIFDYLREGAQ